MSDTEKNSKDDEPTEVESIEEKRTISAVFEEWSRPIGLLLLVLLGYVDFVLEREVSDIYTLIVGALLVGDRISQLIKK